MVVDASTPARLERAGADEVRRRSLRVVELRLAHDADAGRCDQRYHGNAVHGRFVVDLDGERVDDRRVDLTSLKTNVNSSGCRAGYAPRYASRLFFTTVASSGVPSWNLMPSRSLIVHTVLSAFGVTDLARYGSILPFGVRHGQRVVDRARDLDAGDRELRLGEAPAAARLGFEAVGDGAASTGFPSLPLPPPALVLPEPPLLLSSPPPPHAAAISTSTSAGAIQRSALLRNVTL